MKKSYDVAVIGGGIIGSSIAYYLAKEQIDVVMLESGKIGSKTTSAAAGMLGAHSECDDLEVFYQFARFSQQIYSSLDEELKESTGIDIGVTKGGIYKLAFSEEEKKQLEFLCSLSTVDWLNMNEIRLTEPGISNDIIGAAYIKDDVNVLPQAVCKGFSESARLLGAAVYENTHVYEIQRQDSTYVIKTPSGVYEVQSVVIASGVWSESFFQQLGLDHGMVPVKGECLSVVNEGVSLKHTLFHGHSYIMPRNDGTLVIGSTMIKNDWSEHPTLGGIEKLISKAKTMLPAVENMKFDSCWAGLRPQTVDGNPFIGFHPEQEQLLFATGHFRNGVLLAPATGQMIRDLILKREVKKEWVEAFKINRNLYVSV